MPGCGRTHGLEIHHIVHWEDGGVTETWNLAALCRYHHACHHRGTLGIVGNADLPRHREPGVVFTNTWGHRLDPVGQPIRPTPPTGRTDPTGPGSADAAAGAATDPVERVRSAANDIGIAPRSYIPPTGERLDRWGFHLMENPPPDPADTHPTGDDHPDPPPGATDQRPSASPPPPGSPEGPGGADPTRAGPTT